MFAASGPFQFERFNLLVRAGADPNVKNNQGLPGLLRARTSSECLAWLNAGADVDACDEQARTLLMKAAGKPEVVEVLLSRGADASRLDKSGDSGLVYAVREGSTGAVRLLLASGLSDQTRILETAINASLRKLRTLEIQLEAESILWQIPAEVLLGMEEYETLGSDLNRAREIFAILSMGSNKTGD